MVGVCVCGGGGWGGYMSRAVVVVVVVMVVAAVAVIVVPVLVVVLFMVVIVLSYAHSAAAGRHCERMLPGIAASYVFSYGSGMAVARRLGPVKHFCGFG